MLYAGQGSAYDMNFVRPVLCRDEKTNSIIKKMALKTRQKNEK
jgi:hypothetical protein